MSLICAIAPTVGVLLAAERPGSRRRRHDPAGTRVDQRPAHGRAPTLRAMAMFGVASGAAAALGRILGGCVWIEADPFDLRWRRGSLPSSSSVGRAALIAAVVVVAGARPAHRRDRVDLVGASLCSGDPRPAAFTSRSTEGRPSAPPQAAGRGCRSQQPPCSRPARPAPAPVREGRTAPLIPPLIRLRPIQIGCCWPWDSSPPSAAHVRLGWRLRARPECPHWKAD